MYMYATVLIQHQCHMWLYIQLYSPECTLAENININNNNQNKDRNILINTVHCYRCSVACVYLCVLVGHSREFYKTDKPIEVWLAVACPRDKLDILDVSFKTDKLNLVARGQQRCGLGLPVL